MLVRTCRFQGNTLSLFQVKHSTKFVTADHLIQKFNYLQYSELQAEKYFASNT